MEKFNDLFVLICAYLAFLFTDLVPDPEDQYLIGWLYDGTVGLMVVINVGVMIVGVIHTVIDFFKR